MIRIAVLLVLVSGTGSAQAQTAILDTLVLYTQAALNNPGSSDGINTVISEFASRTNQIFRASQVDARISIVHAAQVNYTETTGESPSTDFLSWASSDTEVARLRVEHGADLVHLVGVVDENVCGRGYYAGGDASRAFAFTKVTCDFRIFAHEIGHNLDLRHDRHTIANGYGNEGEPRALTTDGRYGYVNLDGPLCLGTVMSYDRRVCSEAGFSRDDTVSINRFSDPRMYREMQQLGVYVGVGGATVWGAADAVGHLRHAVRVASDFYDR